MRKCGLSGGGHALHLRPANPARDGVEMVDASGEIFGLRTRDRFTYLFFLLWFWFWLL